MLLYIGVIPAFLLFTLISSQNVPLRGPPQFEVNPQYLDSYIPASMQVIAYLTEMMKYDIKPIVATTTTRPPTTTTRKPFTITTKRPVTVTPSRLTTKRPWYTAPPTPFHKPALYAPYIPPSFILSKTPEDSAEGVTSNTHVDSYEEYVNRLKNPLGDYFDRYRQVDPISSIIDQLNRQRRATPFNFTSVPTKKQTVKGDANAMKSRKKRAKPFVPQKVEENQNLKSKYDQKFISLADSRSKATENGKKKPKLARSRSIRSAQQPIDGASDLIDLPPPSKDVTIANNKSSLIITQPNLQVTLSTETNKTKARALSINDDNLNTRTVDYLGFGLNELIKEIQLEREGIENKLNDDDRVKIFSTKYDDVNFGSYLLRQKKIPPTKAYVTLLSLYDLLNKESKKLMLNKFNGYSTAIIEELTETSSGTSSEQLRFILQRIIDRPDTNDHTIRTKITALVTDLSTSNSYINDALRYIPPLPFSR